MDSTKFEIQISIGSKAKGYAIPSSDNDLVIFVKSEKITYLQHFTQGSIIKNKLVNKNDVRNAYTQSDLLTGLVGVYSGKYPYLFIFGNDSNVPNKELLTFVRTIGNARLKRILRNLIMIDIKGKSAYRSAFRQTPKFLLQKLFNLSYVDYCLRYNECPPRNFDISLPNLFLQNDDSDKMIAWYNTLMEKRRNSIDIATDEEISEINLLQTRLEKNVSEMVDPEENCAFLQQIIEYFISDKPFVMK